jgi:poly(glycerol-phosphate) alpha-glucosyltransferase
VERPEVILFARTVSRRVSGGARAVFHRANLFADVGYPVTLVITGTTSDIEVAGLRASGDLHPDVHVRHLWLDGPDWQDQLAAAEHVPVDVPRPDERVPGTVRSVVEPGRSRIVRIEVDGRLRSEEVLDTDGSATRSFRLFDDDGRCRQLWRFVDGKVSMVDDLVDDVPTLRRFFLDGRYCWLTADISGSSGTGVARYASGRVTDYAGVIAEWIDREFAGSRELVVFADGENVWQRVLRRLRHPGVRGVSVLHNSHLDAPYDSEAPTKPDWEPYFTDRTNVEVMVCLTARQRVDLHRRYPDLPLQVVHHAVPAAGRDRDPASERRVIFLGRLAEQKRLADLAAVFARVATAVPDAVLDVYGRGPEEEAFHALVAENGLTDRVVFHGFTHDALGAFRSARVAVMTSWYEGLPLTLTEAMAVGTPWVSYDLNYGPAEVIRDQVDGYLVPPGDIEACARRIIRLLTDDELARRMSMAARDVSSRFSRQRYRREWLEVLQQATRPRPPEQPGTEPGAALMAAAR